MNNFIVALVKSFGLHILVGVTLIASVSFKSTERPIPKVINVEPIEAVSVDKDKLANQINKIKTEKANKKRAEEKRVKDLENRANTAQKKRRNEESKIKDLNKKTRLSKAEKRKAEAATKKAQQKQQREADKAKRLALEAKKKLKEKQAADKATADAKARKRKAEEDERKAAQARKDKAKKAKAKREREAREARERKEQELEMQRQMAQEQAAREKAHNKKVLGEVGKYLALIKQRVEQSMILDESMKGTTCRLSIKLAFNGLVTNVKVLGGDQNTCNAAKSSIYKAGKVPMSKDRAVFEELKSITLTFNPDI